MITPPTFAKRYKIKNDTVYALIRSGDLRAIDVSITRGGRPRWRITHEAIKDFEERRSSKPAPKKPPKRRQKMPKDIVEFV